MKPVIGRALLVLILGCGAADAQPGSTSATPSDAEQRLRALERRLDAAERRVEPPSKPDGGETAVVAVGEIARMTIASYERNFDTIKWIAAAGSFLVTLILGGFAFFGLRQFRQVVKPLRRDHRRLMIQIAGEEEKLVRIMTVVEEQTRSLARHEEEARRNVLALVHLTAAFTYVQLGQTEYLKALRDLDKALEQGPTEPKVLAWAYSIQGFLLKRIKGPREALEATEKSIGHDPTNERTLYNAACYAALANLKPKWVDYLARAVALNPQFAQDAATDQDFTAVREDPDFLRVTGRG